MNQYIGYYYYTYENSSQFTLPASGTYSLTISNQYGDTGPFNFILSDTAAAAPLALAEESGTSVADSIVSGLGANIYKFSGSAGESLYFQAQSQSAEYSDLYWTLYGPANQYEDGGTYWYDFTSTLPSSGTYILVVGGTNPANTSGVSFNFEVYDNVDPVAPLTLGTPVQGTITNPGDLATYTFFGTVGETLFYHGLNASYNSTYVRLNTPLGTQNILDENTSYSSTPFVLPFTGEYSLTVFGNGSSTGDFQFVLDNASAAPSLALSPGNGVTVSDSIPGGLSANVYQLSGTDGELLYVDPLSESTGNLDDLEWILYGPNGQEVDNNYGWYTNIYSDSVTLQYTGPYYLVVEGTNSGNTSGLNYQFAVYDNVDPTSPLSLGVPAGGTITNPGDEARFTFIGAVGQSLFFAGLDSTPVAFAQLESPSGQVIFSSETDQSGGHFQLTQAGTYTVAVNGSGTATGAFNFELEDDSSAPSLALAAGSGTTESDSIATGLSTNLYQISGTAGEALYFQPQAESAGQSDLEWSLWAPGGQSIGGSADPWGGFSATLPDDGTYILALSGTNPLNSAGVSFTFEVFDDVDTSSSLSLGTTTAGTILIPGDTVSYTFAGAAGQSLFLDVLSTDPVMDAQIDDPDGDTIFSESSYQGPVLLATTGTYSLTLSGDNGATGTYSFVLADASTGTMLSPGETATTVSGTITPGTGYAIYQFMGSTGETVSLTSDSFSSTSGNWFVVDPDDNQLATASFGTSFTASLSITGLYTLVLSGSDSTDQNVTYSFDISETMPAQVIESGLPMTASGSLDAGDSISFTFTAPAGLPLYFNSLDRSYGPITAALDDPDGNNILSNNASYNEGPFILSVPGTYTLTLTSSDSSGSDPYSFVLESLADAATSLTIGSVSSGTLAPGTTTAVYSFTGASGENLFLDNQQNEGDPVYLSIFNPALEEIVSVGSYGDSGPFSLTTSGTYYLLVDGESTDGPIDYQFSLIIPTANPISIGAVTNGTLSPAADALAYTFTGTAGTRLTFQFLTESNGSDGASFTLYAPNNEEIGYSYYNNETLTTTLPVSGDYTLVVTNEYYYGPSTFSFTSYVNVDPTTSLNLATAESGTLANAGDEATFTFSGAAGQTFFLEGLNSSDGTYAQVTAPFGTNIVNQYIGYSYYTYESAALFTLPESGNYTLTISNQNGVSGTYDFIVEDTKAAASITLSAGAGTTLSDSLATGVSANIYQLRGTAGEHLYFQAQTQSAGYYDLYWALYGPTNQFVGSGYYWSNLSETLNSSGTYHLIVYGTNASNTSGVNFTFEVFDNTDSLSTLALDTPVMGTITNPGDEATYTFAGTAGQTLYFNGLNSAQGTLAELFGPSGNEIFDQYIADDGYTYNNYGPFTLSESGTFTLIISSEEGDTGDFNFVLKDTVGAASLPLATGAGTATTDAIATGLSANIYQLSGTAGEQVYVQAQTESGGYYDLYWNLYGPNNEYIASAYYWTNFSATLPSTGTYYLVVDGTNASNTSGVQYNFTVRESLVPTSTLTLDTVVSGTIANPGDEATYTFTGTAGQTLYFSALESAAGTEAELVAPGGNQIFNTSYSNQGPFTLSVSGTYTLYLSNQNGTTGPFSFILDDAAEATSISMTAGSGTLESSAISTGLSASIFQFSGTAGEQVYLEPQTNSAGYYDLYWTLYGPNNQVVTGNYFGGNLQATLPSGGTYLLVVDGTNASNTSGVTFSFTAYENVNPTTTLALNTQVTGTITNPGDEATYTFTGSSGQLIEFNGLEPGIYLRDAR